MQDSTIVIRPDLRIGSRVYLTADVIDIPAAIAKGLLNEQTAENLKEQGFYADFSDEKFRVALARRPGGSPLVPLGFTEEFMKANGYLASAAPKKVTPPKASAKKVDKPHRATEPKPAKVPPLPETVDYRGYKITPRARGANSRLPPLWYVTGPDGALKREAGFQNFERAQAFIDPLADADLANDPAAGTSGAP